MVTSFRSVHRCRRARILACSLAVATVAAAQAVAPPAGSEEATVSEYLALLGSVAPAAREGAERYLGAFRARCGRALSSVELRRAVSEGDGDPTLMAMIRASALGDAAQLDRLSAALSCVGR